MKNRNEMSNGVKIIFFLLTAFILTTGCKTPYTPTPTTAVTNYLVVEGLINISDSTYIKLSRTVNISSSATTKPELKAVVTIENNTGNSYALKELGNGTYAAASFNLSAANQYRLRIKTANGSQYVSDFNATMVSPPIDSVNWQATTDLKIYVSTHDPKNATRYYRWDFTEAWEFHSTFDSQLISDGLKISNRTPAQQIWECYTVDASTDITLGTSEKLSNDVISQALINTIAPDAEKIGFKYTIGVKQYALTKDAYDYWTLLKKNTEQLGSIFDSQPSASVGNIHCLNNPDEPVIGYVSTGTITTSRIFILKAQLPGWKTTPFRSFYQCASDSLDCCPPPNPPPHWMPPTTNQFVNFKSLDFYGIKYLQIPIEYIYKGFPPTQIGVFAAEPLCVDCTLRGKTTPPPYWK